MTHNITLTIDDKIHKLVHSDKLLPCTSCSLYSLCKELRLPTPCVGLGGEYFVELKVEK
jgi:hypothetical protein